jgi:hypothetical protein
MANTLTAEQKKKIVGIIAGKIKAKLTELKSLLKLILLKKF